MTENTIIKLFESCGLGGVLAPVLPVQGGFMHRMFRVNTAGGSYAVKHLNPEIMKRPGVMENYRRAEELEQVLEDAGIPIVPAVTVGGRKMQAMDGEYFYIFRWQNGRITDWFNISAEQCRQAGNIQGRIHALRPVYAAGTEPELSRIWIPKMSCGTMAGRSSSISNAWITAIRYHMRCSCPCSGPGSRHAPWIRIR